MALNINGTTGISGVDGTVSAPVLSGTDSNCGISFPAADTIKFSTGGVERMSITDSGVNVTGHILQVVSVRKTDTFTTTSETFVDVTGLTVSITPTSASNKIFVFYSAYLSSTGADFGSVSKLLRGSTQLDIGYNQTNPVQSGTGGTTVNQILDSPNTTSSVTYKIQLRSHSTSHTARIGAGGNGGTDVPKSVITLMEVAA